MKYKTHNELIVVLVKRVEELGNQRIDELRSQQPEATETQAEAVRLARAAKLTRGELIASILMEEFWEEFDVLFEEES